MASSDETHTVVFGKLSGIGLLLFGIAALIVAISYLINTTQTRQASSPHNISTAFPEHDFQLVQLGVMRRDQFLYDKHTGRIWTRVCAGQVSGADCNGTIIWQEMSVDDITPSTSPASNYQPQTQSQKSQ